MSTADPDGKIGEMLHDRLACLSMEMSESIRAAGLVDTAPLDEDVSGHTMMGLVTHNDGRGCSFHSRLGVWATFDTSAPGMVQCLRAHDEDRRYGISG